MKTPAKKPGKQYLSVMEMVRDLADESFAEEYAEYSSKRELVTRLFAIRNAKGVSQQELAKRLGCSQGRISKLENGTDDELRLKDLKAVTKALGIQATVSLSDGGATIVNRVKQHAFAIKHLLGELAKLAEGDEDIASAIAGFYGEAFFNMIRILQESAKKLPKQADGQTPYLRIEMLGDLASGTSDVPARPSDRLAPMA